MLNVRSSRLAIALLAVLSMAEACTDDRVPMLRESDFGPVPVSSNVEGASSLSLRTPALPTKDDKGDALLVDTIAVLMTRTSNGSAKSAVYTAEFPYEANSDVGFDRIEAGEYLVQVEGRSAGSVILAGETKVVAIAGKRVIAKVALHYLHDTGVVIEIEGPGSKPEAPSGYKTPKELEAQMVGQWVGEVNNPWTAPYKVKFEFKKDHSFLASSSSAESPALYYGLDAELRTFEINEIAMGNDGPIGHGRIGFEPGTSFMGDIKWVSISDGGKRLEFQVFNAGYGPLRYTLQRVR